MKLILSEAAKADLRGVRAHIAQHSPAAAARVAASIRERLKLLRSQPRMGRTVPERHDLRELVVDEPR